MIKVVPSLHQQHLESKQYGNATQLANSAPDATLQSQATQATTLNHTSTSSHIHEAITLPTTNINNTIGFLDVMIRSIQTLQSQNKAYQKLATKIHALEQEPQISQSKQATLHKLTQKATTLKEQMQHTFDSAMFHEENVFLKRYGDIMPKSLDAKALSPHTLALKPSQQYAKHLQEQKDAAKEAKKHLQQSLEQQLDTISKTNASYNSLDASKLKHKAFATSHRPITLDRVLHLLR